MRVPDGVCRDVEGDDHIAFDTGHGKPGRYLRGACGADSVAPVLPITLLVCMMCLLRLRIVECLEVGECECTLLAAVPNPFK